MLMGAAIPDTVNPDADTETDEMVRVDPPVLFKTTVWVRVVPTATEPKLKLAGCSVKTLG